MQMLSQHFFEEQNKESLQGEHSGRLSVPRDSGRNRARIKRVGDGMMRFVWVEMCVSLKIDFHCSAYIG